MQGLFKYFNSFMASELNGLDLVICDEAHRLRETSENRFTRAAIAPESHRSRNCSTLPEFLSSSWTNTKWCDPVKPER